MVINSHEILCNYSQPPFSLTFDIYIRLFKQELQLQMMDINQSDEERRRKIKKQAEMHAFTTQLFYFTMKALVCLVFVKYQNYLWGDLKKILFFIGLLIINAYYILTTGNDPGYEPTQIGTDEINNLMSEGIEEDQKALDKQNTCEICLCRVRNRMKHCYRCGRCVRKQDHHCPWIGTCVGQNNHLKFVMMTFFQTIQSIYTFWICFTTLDSYQYKEKDGTYGQEYGVFSIFCMFMALYTIFVGCLFFFHLFLILSNLTTRELISRGKAKYLKGIKGNPFSEGLFENVKMAMDIPSEGHEWQIRINQARRSSSRFKKLFDNQYYSCC